MRRQGRTGLIRAQVLATGCAAAAAMIVLAAGAVSQEIVPRLTGAKNPMEVTDAPPLAKPVTDDVRRARAYPEQPPVIPHAIEGYQLSLRANRCLDCHRPQYVEGSGAPMISITHFMDRQGQMLADVSPRRYFCTQCHVQQTDAQPLLDNNFLGMTTLTDTADQ